MSQANINAHYESILETTGQMLDAARGSDWERLVALETRCAELVGEIRSRDEARPLEGTILRRRAEILRSILAHDAQIREHLQPWMARLGDLLVGSDRARQVRSAYLGRS